MFVPNQVAADVVIVVYCYRECKQIDCSSIAIGIDKINEMSIHRLHSFIDYP